jgi:hypothetical protein
MSVNVVRATIAESRDCVRKAWGTVCNDPGYRGRRRGLSEPTNLPPGKKTLARVECSWLDYGLREEIIQIKRTIVSESLSAFPIQTGLLCLFCAPKLCAPLYRCWFLNRICEGLKVFST